MLIEFDDAAFRLAQPIAEDVIAFASDCTTLSKSAASANLFNRLALTAKGYRLPSEPESARQEFRRMTIELLAVIPDKSKSFVIDCAYQASATVAKRNGRNTIIKLIRRDQPEIEFLFRFKGKRSKNRDAKSLIDFFDNHCESARGMDKNTLNPFHKFQVAKKALGI